MNWKSRVTAPISAIKRQNRTTNLLLEWSWDRDDNLCDTRNAADKQLLFALDAVITDLERH